ncbi:hypothetical protein [Phyllobacterium phragmitis]|uniref:Type I restriction enzyme R protein N-terminal domain-containing protein n=1 Tax=Phyllobacterium phragmitis TaxID=2670329 RepID=A0ABQ0GZ35_9HYPH
MANERITENLVRNQLRDLGYYSLSSDIRVEEQKSEIEAVKRLLRAASKSGKGGNGSPEFIISASSTPDFLVIVECKASVRNHESPTHADPVRYAVDGVLHYANFLSKEFNVIAVAASGQTKTQLKISTFIQTKGSSGAKPLTSRAGSVINEIIPWDDYITHGVFDPAVQKLRHDELMEFSRELHDFMRDHMKLTEAEKPLMVSGTLLALRNKGFVASYDAYSPEELQEQWLHFIKQELKSAEIPNSKEVSITQPYASIAVHPELGKPSGKTAKKFPKGVLHELIRMLNEKVWPFVSVYHDFDIVASFTGNS